MPHILTDNWTLQEIQDALTNGLSPNTAPHLLIDRPRDQHTWKPIPHAAIQVETLLNFITEIVVSDRLVVDDLYSSVWEHKNSAYQDLSAEGLIVKQEFDEKQIIDRRNRSFVFGNLGLTSSIKKELDANNQAFDAGRPQPFPNAYTVFWGAGGYLIRSSMLGIPYSGHPIRRRFIEQSDLHRKNAFASVNGWIEYNRNQVFSSSEGGVDHRSLVVGLSPIASQVVLDSQDLGELFRVALQLRDSYKTFREWLDGYQKALNDEDPNEIIEYGKTMADVSKYVRRKTGVEPRDRISFTINALIVSKPVSFVNPLQLIRPFGIRSVLSRQIFAPGGGPAVDRLMRMFDVEQAALGDEVKHYLNSLAPQS